MVKSVGDKSDNKISTCPYYPGQRKIRKWDEQHRSSYTMAPATDQLALLEQKKGVMCMFLIKSDRLCHTV